MIHSQFSVPFSNFKALFPPGVDPTYGGEALPGLKQCRFFIPPSCLSTDVQLMMSQPCEALVIARIGTLIQNQSVNNANAITNSGLVSLPSHGFGEAQLLNGDCIGRNSSGMLTVMRGPSSVGGWLYIYVIIRQGGITRGNFSFTVDAALYPKWYSSVVWDAAGDPVEGGTVIIPPVDPIDPPVDPPVIDDGTKRMIFRNSATGENMLWEVTGTTKKIVSLENAKPQWDVMTVLPGIGSQYDIVWRNIDGRVAMWRMDGAKAVSKIGLGTIQDGWEFVG